MHVPTLMVRGAESDVVSKDGAAELRRLIPGAKEADVPGAGHMVVGDDNDAFSREVLTFLADLPDVRDGGDRP